MPGPIETFLTTDHVRIDELLAASERDDGTIDVEVFAAFRQALLKHIAMEEKVLVPLAKRKRSGDPLPIAEALRKDHGEIAALLVPRPSSRSFARCRRCRWRRITTAR